jgi:hypothetical protein
MDLYQKAMSFVDLPYPKIHLINTTADGYLIDLINDTEVDFVINIDEDAFLYDINSLQELILYVAENNYVNCGMPDGGIVHLRHFNPLVTNPFFNIFNTKILRDKIAEYKEEDYNKHKDTYIDKVPFNIIKGPYEYVYYEPYYPLLIWISQNFKTLYLTANTHKDGLTTILNDHKGMPFLMHTWFSRFYGMDFQQTKRINNILKECECLSRKIVKKLPLEKKIFFSIKLYCNATKQWLVKIKKSLMR